MPKPVLFEAPKKKRKKKKKRKVDYTVLLQPPPVVSTQCPHTKRTQDASACSQCMLVKPSVVHKPVVRDWWEDDPELEISLEQIAEKLGGKHVVELTDGDYIDLNPDADD